jgi:hypothetical protein
MSVETWNHVLNPAQREHLMVSTVCTVTLNSSNMYFWKEKKKKERN